jgi:hypothetical protein
VPQPLTYPGPPQQAQRGERRPRPIAAVSPVVADELERAPDDAVSDDDRDGEDDDVVDVVDDGSDGAGDGARGDVAVVGAGACGETREDVAIAVMGACGSVGACVTVGSRPVPERREGVSVVARGAEGGRRSGGDRASDDAGAGGGSEPAGAGAGSVGARVATGASRAWRAPDKARRMVPAARAMQVSVSHAAARLTTPPARPARPASHVTAECSVHVESPTARPPTMPSAGSHPMSRQRLATACPMTSPMMPPVSVANTLVTVLAAATPAARACGTTSVANRRASRPAAVAGSDVVWVDSSLIWGREMRVCCVGIVTVGAASGLKAQSRRSRAAVATNVAAASVSSSRVAADVQSRAMATVSAARCRG